MQTVINKKVSVISLYDINQNLFIPQKIKWGQKIIDIKTVAYHHKIKKGVKLLHIFSVASLDTAFRLSFDTDNLSWTLEEVADGFAN